jgi:hypothetical protein
MEVPESMPMLFRHTSSEEIPALGRITNPKKVTIDGVKSLRITGVFDMGSGGSDDPLAAIRRGMAHMVHAGTLDAMSVRWDDIPGKATPRRNLPSDHFAHVDLSKNPDHPGAWGWFFEKSVAREGSIVAIGADPTALMGRSTETDDPLEQTFWAALARSVEANTDGMGDIVAGFDAMQDVIVDLRESGCNDVDIVNAIGSLAGLHEQDLIPCHYGNGKTFYVPREAWTVLRAEKSAEYWAALHLAAESPEVVLEEASPREDPKESVEVSPEVEAPRTVGADELQSLMRETATESAKRKINFALGKV